MIFLVSQPSIDWNNFLIYINQFAGRSVTKKMEGKKLTQLPAYVSTLDDIKNPTSKLFDVTDLTLKHLTLSFLIAETNKAVLCEISCYMPVINKDYYGIVTGNLFEWKTFLISKLQIDTRQVANEIEVELEKLDLNIILFKDYKRRNLGDGTWQLE